MGSLLDLQSTKYRFVLDLIKNEEPYDKSMKVMSGLEALYLCHKRYEQLQNILAPLKNIIGNDIAITSVSFPNNMQDETGIAIRYVKDSKLCMMIIRLFDLEAFEISLSDPELDNEEFLEANRDVINGVIEELTRFEYMDEPELLFKSCSKKFIICDNCNDFVIKSVDEKSLSIGTNHYTYDKEKKLFIPEKINSDNVTLKEELMNEEIIQKIYNNIRIDAEGFPKELIKKIS